MNRQRRRQPGWLRNNLRGWGARPAAMPAFAFSKRAVERTAVNQEVLAGNVAGVRRTQERAGGADLVRVAEACGRNGGDAVGSSLCNALALSSNSPPEGSA